MTRPDKRAARFGDRYQPPLDWRRLRKAIKAGLPLIKRMTEAFRCALERVREGELAIVPSQTQPGRLAIVPTDWTLIGYVGEGGIRPAWEPTDNRPAFWHEPPAIGSTTGRIGGRIGPPTDILDRIDHALAYSPDARRVEGDQDWPYRSF